MCLSSAIAAFGAQQTFAAGTGPQSVAVGDLNSDGMPDMVVANFSSGNVSVLLGNGNGTFGAQQTFAVGSQPYAVAIADVNGDGKPDIVVANSGSASVSVLLGNGNGTFLPQQTFSSGNGAHSLAIADLNGDGKLDIAVANKTSGSVSILLGNGNGTFQPQQTFAASAGTAAIAIADLNSDGKLDLVVANQNANSVGVFYGTGTGSFLAQVPYPLGAAGPDSVAVSDLNGDGKPDIVVANQTAGMAAVLLNTGTGTFANPQSKQVGSKPFFVTVADVNGDGKPDIVTANYSSNNISVLLGNGDGSFQPQVTFATGTQPSAVAVADVNGDGRLDLLAPNFGSGNVSVLLGDVPPVVLSINRSNPSGPSTSDSIVSFTVTFNEPVTGVDPTDFSLALSGVTASTPVVTPLTTSVYTVTVSGISGTGTLGLNFVDNGSIRDSAGNPLQPDGGTTAFGTQQTFGSPHTYAVAVSDVNGDGKPDLLVTTRYNNSVSVLLGNGDGTFRPQQTFATGAKPRSLDVADVNGDGRPDLVVVNVSSNTVGVLLGNGDGTFQAQQTWATGLHPYSVAVADVNGDGKPDLVVANYGGKSVGVFLGNGNGTFQPQLTFATGTSPSSVAVSDVNGDGKPDLVVANTQSWTVSVLLGNGNGTFQAQKTFASEFNPCFVTIADINGDGKPDLVVANNYAYNVSVFLGNGDGTFQTQRTFLASDLPNSIAVADVNGDGRLDLVVASDDRLGILLGNGNGTLQPQQAFANLSLPLLLSTIVVADVNGDGRPDLVFSNQVGPVSILEGTANGSFTGQVYTIVPSLDTITGTVGIDQITLVQDPDHIHIDWTLNGTTTCQMLINDASGLAINGAGSSDVITLDYTNGHPLPNKLILNGSFTLSGLGTIGNPLAGTTIDLKASTLFITYAGPVNDPLSTIRGYLKNGYNAGVWNGVPTATTGVITSTAAAGNPNHSTGIGYANSAEGLVSLPANTIELKYTLYGDTGLTGSVGFTDFMRMTQHYTLTGQTWATGDFNYDGTVDGNDFNLQQPNYGQTLPALVLAPVLTPIVVAPLNSPKDTTSADPTRTGSASPKAVTYPAKSDDGSGNANALLGDVPPAVLSINRSNPSGPSTNVSSVSFTVTFSEPVTGVDPTDFVVPTTGTVTDTLTQVTDSGSVYTVTISGITGNGTLGLNLVDNGSIRDLAANPLQSTTASFGPQATFATGTNPESVTTADVNGDGKVDLIAANTSTTASNVSVLLGNGNGTFKGQATFATGKNSMSVTVADVNGDGKPDLIVINNGDADVGVLLGNGNGTFKSQATFATEQSPNSVTVADVNGDGKLDLIVANNGNNLLSVLLGNGNGTFQAHTLVIAGSNPASVTTADLNRDGKVDLIVSNKTQNGTTVSVLLGNGNGTFQPQVTFATGKVPSFVTTADVNSDGNPDLIIANQISNTVSVLLGNGDGTFQNQATYATGITPAVVTTADVNGDGKLDLIVTNAQSDSLSVLLGNGNGTFQTQTTFANEPFPYSLATADVNGDGRPDLVVTNLQSGFLSVLLNSANGDFTGQTYTIDTIDPSVVSINRAAPVGPITSAGSASFTVTFSEPVTGVNPTDFVVPTTGTVADTLTQVNGSGNIYAVTISGIAGNGTLGLNLVDNNSIRDLAGNPLRANNLATFQSQQTFAVGTSASAVTSADVNVDGRPDLVVTNFGDNSVGVLLGNGNGTFQPQQTFATGSEPDSVAVADLNGDGKPDLIVTNYGSPSSVSVLLGNGNGKFQAQHTFAAGANPDSVAVADVNGDGKLDLIIANSGSNTVSVLLGNGNGTFQSQLTSAVGRWPKSVAVADLNGDGKPDIITANYVGNNVSVLLGNGDGTFQLQQTFAAASPWGMAVADVNADGRADIVVAESKANAVGVLLGNGNGTFQAQQTFAAPGDPLSVAAADVNGDGTLDLLVGSNFDGNNVSLLLGNGDGTFQNWQTFAAEANPFYVGVSDLNGDGRPDLFVANSGNSDSVSVLLNNSNGNFTGQTYNIVSSLDTITGTAGVDQITLAEDPDGVHIDWYLNGFPSGQMSIADSNGLTINGNGSTDVITLDYTNGNPLPNKLNLNGIFTITNLATTGNPLAGTTIDLKTSTLFVSYGSPSSDPLAQIRGYLQNGYNAGLWNGTPSATTGVITSSAAAGNSNHSTAIGYADSAQGLVSLPANTIELKYTLYGDTGLTGSVGFTDFMRMTQHYTLTGQTWATGDFNYDGTVDTSDFNLQQPNYGQTLPAPAPTPALVMTPIVVAPVTPAAPPATIVTNPPLTSTPVDSHGKGKAKLVVTVVAKSKSTPKADKAYPKRR